jgi:drug/metabolite transporter (DMT)-like permease
MIYLILCILSSTLILVVFKTMNRLRIRTLDAIVINYLAASALGMLTGRSAGFTPFDRDWFLMSLILGIMFVFMFNVIGYSARVAGVTVTSLTTKLSVVVPVLFSILMFGENISFLKISGMILALAAIVMIVYRPRQPGESRSELKRLIWLPVILFFGAGFIDSFIKYAQEIYVPGDEILAFSTSTFMIAAITSIGFRIASRSGIEENKWHRLVAGGIALGLVNFGSLYFLVMAFESERFDSSVVFGINNIGIVMLSVLAGMVLFREKTTKLNKAGILLAIVSILILFYS